MAVDKPSGMAVHTGSGITGGTLVDYVRAYLGPKAVRNDFTASPAHRLDRETSGRHPRRQAPPGDGPLHRRLHPRTSAQALPDTGQGQDAARTQASLTSRSSEHQQTAESKARRGVNMQEAVTRWKVIKQSGEAALLSCVIETGRTHQIRRHLTAIGHPVAGDKKYGDFAFNRDVRARWGLKRLFLHAERIEFPHPAHGGKVAVEAHTAPGVEGRAASAPRWNPHEPESRDADRSDASPPVEAGARRRSAQAPLLGAAAEVRRVGWR